MIDRSKNINRGGRAAQHWWTVRLLPAKRISKSSFNQ